MADSTDDIRRAWEQRESEKRKVSRSSNLEDMTVPQSYRYVKDVLTDGTVIVTDGGKTWKVPFKAEDGDISFGDETRVKIKYVELTESLAALSRANGAAVSAVADGIWIGEDDV